MVEPRDAFAVGTGRVGRPGARVVIALLGALLGVSGLAAQEAPAAPGEQRLRASHENLPADSRTDEYGIFVPVPASHPARRFPADDDFPTGPAVGEALPDFQLRDQHGDLVDFTTDRAGRRAAVLFQRSAVW